jgi:hypothetical protein
MLARARPQRKITYCKGDVIKVIEGDLKNLMGTVESCDDTTVTIMPRHPDLHDLLQIPINQVRVCVHVLVRVPVPLPVCLDMCLYVYICVCQCTCSCMALLTSRAGPEALQGGRPRQSR